MSKGQLKAVSDALHNGAEPAEVWGKMAPPNAIIHNVRGYDGLPDQFVVVSQYGYLGKDSFVNSLSRAFIFRTEADAQQYIEKLYPAAITRAERAEGK